MNLEKFRVRYPALLLPLCLLAGCGATSANSPTPTPHIVAQHAVKQWSQPPAMAINPNKRYVATVQTSDGTFQIELLPKLAPVTVNNFVFLARHHYYDHNQFFRIIQDFMVQTGDPTASGSGGPGYIFNDEIHRKYHLHYAVGTVAMANRGQNTNGSQFFVVTGPQGASLKYSYTIFGYVHPNGFPVLRKIAATPVGENLASGETSQPLNPVYMKRVTIQVLPPLHKGAKAKR